MSTLKVNTLTDTAATKSVPIEDVVNGTARAWVNFNGTGTVAIRAQYNVSSITDNSTGDYTVNFTNAMTDANYSYSCHCETITGNTASFVTTPTGYTQTASAFRIRAVNGAGTLTDNQLIAVSIFR